MRWLSLLEPFLVDTLLKSPTFHNAVRGVHRGVQRIRHGVHPEDMGGTKLDKQESRFVQHFIDELRDQAGLQPLKRSGQIADKSRTGQSGSRSGNK